MMTVSIQNTFYSFQLQHYLICSLIQFIKLNAQDLFESLRLKFKYKEFYCKSVQIQSIWSKVYFYCNNINSSNIKQVHKHLQQKSSIIQVQTNSIDQKHNYPNSTSQSRSQIQHEHKIEKLPSSTQKNHLEMTEVKQKQEQKKQMLLNNYIDELLSLEITQKPKSVTQSNMKSMPKQGINFMELFDLLIWTEKKKPLLLQNILQMNILTKCVNLLAHEQLSKQIKAFILLINNCKVNGEIIMYLLVNRLLDQIIWNYLQAIAHHSKQQNQAIDQELQYLGSLLKASNNHLNDKTYPYFLNPPQFSNIIHRQQQQRQPYKNKNGPSSHKQKSGKLKTKEQEKKPVNIAQKSFIFDSNDIFSAFDRIHISNQDISTQKSKQNSFQQQVPQSLIKSHKIVYKQCLLIKVCTRFYNCPEQLTKTTIMNILMNILRQPFAQQLIINPITIKPYSFITQWSHNMCCLLRNQLKNFNQQLMVLEKSQHWLFIQQINDKVMFWEDLTQGQLAQSIFGQKLMHLVIYSLIIGSLNTYSLPMFNIKFTFFILAKMINVCSNLGLVEHLSALLFLKNDIMYQQNWVSTAVMKGFDAKEILNDKYYELHASQEDEVNEFSGINEFFFNILKSKDEHFLQISSNMLHQIISTVRKDEKVFKSFNLNLGFTLNGSTLIKITSTLIGQLKFDHSLQTLKQVCETIIFLHSSKQLSQQNSNQFVYCHAQYINQTLDMLEKGQKLWSYITETFQYDMKILGMLKFNHKPFSDQELLIHPSERVIQQKINSQKDYKSENKNKFYTSIPEFPSQILRFKIVKSFLMLKFNQLMIQQGQRTQLISKYVEKLRIWEQKQLKPGDKIPYPLKQKFYQCRIIEEKTQIPCILIEDDVYFILGFIEAKNVKIIMNAKLKHIKTEIYTKKDKAFIKVNISRFDFDRQNIFPKSTVLIKGLDQGLQYFSVKKQNFKEKQLNSIRKGLKKTVQNLPEISLL